MIIMYGQCLHDIFVCCACVSFIPHNSIRGVNHKPCFLVVHGLIILILYLKLSFFSPNLNDMITYSLICGVKLIHCR